MENRATIIEQPSASFRRMLVTYKAEEDLGKPRSFSLLHEIDKREILRGLFFCASLYLQNEKKVFTE